MSKQLMQSSQQIAVSLALVIVTKTENDPSTGSGQARLATLPLVQLTPILFWLWTIRQKADSWEQKVESYLLSAVGYLLDMLDQFTAPVLLMSKVLSIGFTSLAFGMGVRL